MRKNAKSTNPQHNQKVTKFNNNTFSQKRGTLKTNPVKLEKKESEVQLSDQKFSQNNQHRKEEKGILQEEDVWDNYQDIYKPFQAYSYGFLDSFTLQRQVEWQQLIRKQKCKRNGLTQRRRNQYDYLNYVSVQTQTKMEVSHIENNKLFTNGRQFKKKKINLTQINHTYKIELEYEIKQTGKSDIKKEQSQKQMNNTNEKFNGQKFFEVEITPLETCYTKECRMNQQQIHSSDNNYRLLFVNKEQQEQAKQSIRGRNSLNIIRIIETIIRTSQKRKKNKLKKILTGEQQMYPNLNRLNYCLKCLNKKQMKMDLVINRLNKPSLSKEI